MREGSDMGVLGTMRGRTALMILAGAMACRPGVAAAPSKPPAQAAPATMKAIRFHAYGDPGVLVYEDAPLPRPGAGEMLVRVRAAGVNPVDWKIRKGGWKSLGLALP